MCSIKLKAVAEKIRKVTKIFNKHIFEAKYFVAISNAQKSNPHYNIMKALSEICCLMPIPPLE